MKPLKNSNKKMNALKNPGNIKKQVIEERNKRICDNYKALIDIGSDPTASALNISEEEGLNISWVWVILGRSGLAGKNKNKIETIETITQPA